MKSDYKWLESWINILQGKHVLELGCGSGIDTKYICQHAKSVIACDKTPPERTEKRATFLTVDHSRKLPFEDNKFDVVVASLCLHYFNDSKTTDIICEISRVLKREGVLICRVNSTNDFNFGANGYSGLEDNLFCVEGVTKRFFNEGDVNSFFSDPWTLTNVEHKIIDRYEKEKAIWAFCAVNT